MCTMKELCAELKEAYKNGTYNGDVFTKRFFTHFRSLLNQAGCEFARTIVKNSFGEEGVFTFQVHGGFYLTFTKMKKDGTLSKSYTKIYSLSRVRSGSISDDDLVDLLNSYEKTGKEYNPTTVDDFKVGQDVFFSFNERHQNWSWPDVKSISDGVITVKYVWWQKPVADKFVNSNETAEFTQEDIGKRLFPSWESAYIATKLN